MGFFYWGERNSPTANKNGDEEWWRTARVRDFFPIRRLPRIPELDRRALSERAWRNADVERVPLDRLYATQDWISDRGLRHHSRPGARPDGGTWPCVIAHQGQYWLIDGHHRAICAVQRGERHIRAHVQRARKETDR
jgi:hypothetical protein